MITLSDVKEVQPKWFSPQNKRFFGDISYEVLQGKMSKTPYLVRSTFAWTDMCGGEKTLQYRVNYIEDDLKIGELVETTFKTRDEVKEWLKEN